MTSSKSCAVRRSIYDNKLGLEIPSICKFYASPIFACFLPPWQLFPRRDFTPRAG